MSVKERNRKLTETKFLIYVLAQRNFVFTLALTIATITRIHAKRKNHKRKMAQINNVFVGAQMGKGIILFIASNFQCL